MDRELIVIKSAAFAQFKYGFNNNLDNAEHHNVENGTRPHPSPCYFLTSRRIEKAASLHVTLTPFDDTHSGMTLKHIEVAPVPYLQKIFSQLKKMAQTWKKILLCSVGALSGRVSKCSY